MSAPTAVRPSVGGGRTALLIIDLQRAYFADGELARCRRDLVETANRLIDAATAAGAPVIEVRTEHAADRSTWTMTMLAEETPLLIAGSPGTERLPGLRPVADVVVKTRDSAFHGTDLAERLAAAEVSTVVLAGVSTESCIVATATEAYARDLVVVLARDAIASVDPEWHDRSLSDLQRKYYQPALAAADIDFAPVHREEST